MVLVMRALLSASEASVGVSLPVLLTGRLHFTSIEAKHARINLVNKKDGSDNWTFDDTTQPSEPDDTKSAAGDTSANNIDRLSVSVFELTNVKSNTVTKSTVWRFMISSSCL